MSAYLEISHLSQAFDNGNDKTVAFSDVSFTLNRGDFLCVLGPSGCGKTTLLRCLAGLQKPTSGEISIDGTAVTDPGRHCAMVFQTFDQLLPWKTVQGNVMYPLLVNRENGYTKERAGDESAKYLEMVGLTKFLNYYPHQLSGGMKQRVAIARSLATKPQLLLMDEPFASLDADTRTGLQKELLHIWKESGATVLFVTHSLIEAIALSSRMLVMGSGSKNIELFMDNPVEGEPGILRTPQSPGYSECWALLSDTIRRERSGGAESGESDQDNERQQKES